MKIRYVGSYDGYSPIARKLVKRGDVFEVDDEVGRRLLMTKQFKQVRVPKPKKEEEETTAKEVTSRGEMARPS